MLLRFGPCSGKTSRPGSLVAVRHVVDGDTVAHLLDLGDSAYRRRNLFDVNVPEAVGETRAAGPEAKAFPERLLPPGLAVYVAIHKNRTTFQRLLRGVFDEVEPGEPMNTGGALVEAGHATRRDRTWQARRARWRG